MGLAGTGPWLCASPPMQRLSLPPYSPELNPDELLNQDVKTNALGRRRPRDLGQMMHGVRGFLWSRQRTPRIVRRYFEKSHVRYAAL